MSVKAALAAYRHELQQERENPHAGFGLPTGIPGLDKRTRGLRPGTVTVLAGRTSMGKSAVALTILGNICETLVEEGDARLVALISAEMSAPQVIQRLVAQQLGYDRDDIVYERLTELQLQRLEALEQRLEGWPLEIYDVPGPTLDDVRVAIDRMAGGWREGRGESPFALIVVDHIGKMKVPTKYGQEDSEYRTVTAAADFFFEMARYYNCPVIEVAQINRGVEGRIEKGIEFTRPLPSDLRGSGHLEDNADTIVLLWRRERYEAMLEGREENVGPLELNVAKNRVGPTGAVYVTFDPAHTRVITSVEREADALLEGLDL